MKKLIGIVLIFLSFKWSLSQKCVTKGITDDGVPLVYDGPPFKLDSNHNQKLMEICPHLIASNIESTVVCCDENQLDFMIISFQMFMESLFPTCPQCLFSIKSVFCNLACSPKQSSFVNVTAISENKFVAESDYHVSQSYMEGVFNSCKDNKNPQTGEKIVHQFCRKDNCTAVDLLGYFFSHGPYKVNLVEEKGASKDPKTEKSYPCNSSLTIGRNTYPRCSCTHCKKSCFLNVTFTDPPQKLILNFLTYYDVAILTIWGLILVASIVLFIVRYFSKKKRLSLSSNRNSTTLSDEELHEPNLKKENQRLSVILRGMRYIIDRVCRLTVKFRYFSMIFFLLLAIGLSVTLFFKMKLTSDPMDLWVPDKTDITNNYRDFNKHFGGFFRIEQVIISSKAKGVNYNDYTGSAFNKDLFIKVAQLLEKIKKLTATYSYKGGNHTVSLSDICYKPTAPDYDSCVITSPIEYFQGSLANLLKTEDKWIQHTVNCIEKPTNINDSITNNFSLSCLSTFLAPIDPQLVFGGYEGEKITLADTIVMTITVNNHEKKEDQIPAVAWEREFIKLLKNEQFGSDFTISFSSESSVEDELYRGSFKDVKIAAISYVLMFVYVCLGIGKFSVRIRDLMVDVKLCTAIGGILIIILSVSTTLGIFSLSGQKINLVVIEVLPFLLLAIGADNFFLLDHYFMSTLMSLYEKGDLNIKLATQKAIRKAGVGICISALVNTVTFFIGMVNDMPVVRFFSLASAIAMIITFVFQITIFIPLMFLDNVRMMSNRTALFFIKVEENEDHPVGDSSRYREGPVRKYVRKVHQNIVTHRYAAYSIITLFVLLWGAMLICASKLQIGLDQQMALPTDSYMQDYFDSVFSKLKVGAPYFVVISSGLDYSKEAERNKICSLSSCDMKSLGNLLSFAAQKSNETRLATTSNNWIDTYLQWLVAKDLPSCCMVVKQELDQKGEVVRNVTNFTFCTRDMFDSKHYKCESCLPMSRSPMSPTEDEFNLFLPHFLNDIPRLDGCILGGKPAFKTSVVLNPDYYSVPRKSNLSVITSRFMGYHTQLVSSSSFIDSLVKALKIQKLLNQLIGFNTYMYSIFYVYYQGYVNLIYHAIKVYSLMCLGIVVFSFVVFFFKARISVIYAVTVIMTNVSILFLMFIFKVHLNPVSLVNLIMMFAISVEFSIHIAVAYMNSRKRNPIDRARDALMHSGASVFSGIAITKIVGVSVLAFASSKIFIEYYFKMYCFAIISGILHGLIFLPACLSIFGPVGSDDVDFLPVSLSE